MLGLDGGPGDLFHPGVTLPRRTPQSALIHEIVAALVAAETADNNTTCVGFATAQTLKFFQKVGYAPVADDAGQTLAAKDFPQQGEAWLIEISQASDFAKECLARHHSVLSSRLRGA
jgi:hypothetical protein